MITRLTNFNLVYGATLYFLFIVDSRTMGYTDIITNIGFISTLWYNWEIKKRLNGQPIQFRKINFGVGLSTLLFAVLLTLTSARSMFIGLNSETVSTGIIVLGGLDFILAVTVTLHTILTLKLNSVE